MSDGNKIELSGIFSEGYGIIPKKLMRSKDIGVYEKVITAYMLSYTGGGNECFPSYKRIADDLNISEPTIAKSIKRLVEKGYIRKEKLYPEDRLKHNNKYILSFVDTPILNEVKSHATPDLAPRHATFSSNNNSINNNILTQVLEKWNAKSGLMHHSFDTANRKFQKKHYNEINDYGIEATLAAIENYAEVLSSDKYYWSHRYSLWDFVARALDKFIADAKPRENFLKKNKPGGDGIPTTTDEIRRAYAR